MRSAPLDGVRAVAVAAVLFYHAHYPWAVGGYVGVDVFFVLSGFLITRVLLSTERSWSGYRHFLLRRAVRLVPALLTATAGVLLLVAAIGTAHDRSVAGSCSAASVTYLMNFPFADSLSCPALWHVTWSLAAEQQFYLLWPLLLAGLLSSSRWGWTGWDRDTVPGRLRRAGIVVLGLYGAEVLWQIVQRAEGVSTARVAYAPDGRSLVLLLGCALALLTARQGHRPQPLLSRQRADTVGALALAALLICFGFGALAADVPALVPLVATGVASLALVAVAAYGPPQARIARFLGAGPMAWLGRISYSLYLWHEVAYRLAEAVSPRGTATAEVLRFVLALTLAAASYQWVELPAQRRWGRRRAPSPAPQTLVSA